MCSLRLGTHILYWRHAFMFLEDGLEIIAGTETTLLCYGLDGVVWMLVHEFLGVVDAYGLNPLWV